MDIDKKVVKVLSISQFCQVLLVQDMKTKQLHIIKRFNKQEVLSDQAKLIMAKRQKEALSTLSKINRVNILLGTSQDVKWLNLHLALAPGLGLHQLLATFKSIPSPILDYIAAQVVLTLQNLHQSQYVYRDLKASHVVVHTDFSINLIDFGFTKRIGKKGRTNSICGTLHAMAPEIIKNCYSQQSSADYNFSVDVYAFGVLLFQMICGQVIIDFFSKCQHLGEYRKPPQGYYNDNGEFQAKRAYLRQRLDQPFKKEDRDLLKSLSPISSVQLIQKIINSNEQDRPSWEQIKSSEFFKSINFNDIDDPEFVMPWVNEGKLNKSSKIADFIDFIIMKGMFNRKDLEIENQDLLTEEEQKIFADF